MKKILITGGAGFLGSNLVEKLIAENNYIIALDNLSTGSTHNIDRFREHPNFEFYECDVLQLPHFEVDEIYNLACPASPPKYQIDPIKTLDTCYLGVKNCLELAIKTGAKFLQASTSEVYGDPKVHPQDENYWGHVNPIGVRSCYDEGKRISETLTMEYSARYNLHSNVVRIFNTYGPYMDKNDGRVISNFINQALNDEQITIYGNGTQSRSFCYVSDLIDGLQKLMNYSSPTFQPVNIGNPIEFSINDIAQKVITMTKSKSEIVHLELPSDDPKVRQPNIGLAKHTLGWSPTVSLSDGLTETINYFKNCT